MSQLGLSSLAELPAGIARPAYDPRQVRVGVLHFGPGAFHRAHQGAYFDRLLASDPRWGIAAVSLRSGETVDALDRQDGLYSLSILDREPSVAILAPHREWIGPGEEHRLQARLLHPDLALVTATVTEKGYCLAGDGALDFAHPDITHDVAHPHAPRSLPGWIVAGLAGRRAQKLPPLTVLSCDNLGQNGRKLGTAVVALANARDPELARFIEDEVRFPNTMVDSITPASDPAFLDQVQGRLGVDDRAAVKREAFTQWVIERSDAAKLPDLALAGATFTADVAGWERAKLRILNGAHSTLAYLGLLRGHRTVADAMQDRELAVFVEAMIRDEVWPGLRPTDGLDLESYTADVLARFRNPAIDHLLAQIAWDGSQKLPYRLLGSIADAIDSGRSFDRLATGVAAWMAFCAIRARAGEAINDPLAPQLVEAALTALSRRSVEAMLNLTPVFPRAVATHRGLRSAVNARFQALIDNPLATLS